jgi:hypothetical protein
MAKLVHKLRGNYRMIYEKAHGDNCKHNPNRKIEA